jgi:hypothetical protein
MGKATLKGFKMYTMGHASNIPFIVHTGDEEDTVTVEVFELTGDMMHDQFGIQRRNYELVQKWQGIIETIDWLEGSPDWYERVGVMAELESGETIKTWVYRFPQDVYEEYAAHDRANEVRTGDWEHPFAEAEREAV